MIGRSLWGSGPPGQTGGQDSTVGSMGRWFGTDKGMVTPGGESPAASGSLSKSLLEAPLPGSFSLAKLTHMECFLQGYLAKREPSFLWVSSP